MSTYFTFNCINIFWNLATTSCLNIFQEATQRIRNLFPQNLTYNPQPQIQADRVSAAADTDPPLSRIKSITGEPSKAQIFLLGDTHTDESQIPLRRALLDQYAAAGDYVLLEGYQRYILLNGKCFSKSIGREDLMVMGWDDWKTLKESNRLTALLWNIATLHDKKMKEGSLTPMHAEIAAKAIALHSKKSEYLDLVVRNEWLLDAILTIRSIEPEKKIFVIAGGDHLNEDLLGRLHDESYCCIKFTDKDKDSQDPQVVKKGDDYIKNLVKRAPSTRLNHLLQLREVVGPCVLLKPVLHREDLRPKEVFDAK